MGWARINGIHSAYNKIGNRMYIDQYTGVMPTYPLASYQVTIHTRMFWKEVHTFYRKSNEQKWRDAWLHSHVIRTQRWLAIVYNNSNTSIHHSLYNMQTGIQIVLHIGPALALVLPDALNEAHVFLDLCLSIADACMNDKYFWWDNLSGVK